MAFAPFGPRCLDFPQQRSSSFPIQQSAYPSKSTLTLHCDKANVTLPPIQLEMSHLHVPPRRLICCQPPLHAQKHIPQWSRRHLRPVADADWALCLPTRDGIWRYIYRRFPRAADLSASLNILLARLGTSLSGHDVSCSLWKLRAEGASLNSKAVAVKASQRIC